MVNFVCFSSSSVSNENLVNLHDIVYVVLDKDLPGLPFYSDWAIFDILLAPFHVTKQVAYWQLLKILTDFDRFTKGAL